MDASEAALLVVDVQHRILKAIPDAAHVIWNCRRLIDGAGILGVPAAATEQYPEKLGGTNELVAKRLEATGVAPPLAKIAFSCGEHGALAEGWLAAGRRKVLLCGIETHVCIQQTALDYTAAGLEVYVAVDAVASRHAVDHETALRRMESCGVSLVTTESALCEWAAIAGSPEFKMVSALLKENAPG